MLRRRHKAKGDADYLPPVSFLQQMLAVLILRLQLQATALRLQVHPMSQAPQEFAEMKPWYDRLHQLLLGKPAQQETVQMFCRIGYCAEQQPTPRRVLQSFLQV